MVKELARLHHFTKRTNASPYGTLNPSTFRHFGLSIKSNKKEEKKKE
jgi:hypothetical protein